MPDSHEEQVLTHPDDRLSAEVDLTFSLESNSTLSSQEFQQDVQNETCFSATNLGGAPVGNLRTIHASNCYDSAPFKRVDGDNGAAKENNFLRPVHQPSGSSYDTSGNHQNSGAAGAECAEGEQTVSTQSKLKGFRKPTVMGKSPLLPSNGGGNYASPKETGEG